MDGSVLEHSDSDSGESWTLLENVPTVADEAPEFSEVPSRLEGGIPDNDKDEDTDGISIISDSDPESSSPCELTFDKCFLEENCPTEPQYSEFVSINPLPSNNNENLHESIRGDDDLLADSNSKHKTYVHRRNKRLSTVLNIIVLGSVITAAGVAIGHMWGAKNECQMYTTPSVNKILSNLYKLQEENAYLRNKLKELTLVNNIHIQQRKLGSDKLPSHKHHKCRKIFEESLNSKNAHKLTKCVDNDSTIDKLLETRLIDHEYEKDFLQDIDKLKNVYQQNKSWLDDEIARRLKQEEQSVKNIRYNLKSPKSIRVNEEQNTLKDETQLPATNESPLNTETVINVTEPIILPLANNPKDTAEETKKRITYADSLKSGHEIKKRENKIVNESKAKEHYKKKRRPKEYDIASVNSASDEEFRKDDRYNEHKFKMERKKNDRHKTYKKQKRRNKYEQWEMKGGYMKDYDDFSVTSSLENDYVLKNTDKNYLSRDFERNNLINQFSESDVNAKSVDTIEGGGRKENRGSKRSQVKKEKDTNWYEKRAALRTEARKKLEQELFGESTPNTAGWYFRRMQKREQCRVKGDNSTYKKLSKRIMNFKTKH